ncbi:MULTISPECIES: hypothetical protein [Thiothrix]|uniref:hypothetical protein n=1 Tax=Thiothrix TaxID=1030 RepID=UPI0025803E82|nr:MULTISPECIES: hypothetical protein [Thiothrix]MDX9987350.1 hypothetical protein [Thiothrix unzii]
MELVLLPGSWAMVELLRGRTASERQCYLGCIGYSFPIEKPRLTSLLRKVAAS